MSAARYRSVVLDVDSTLCGIEGVDWLAQRRGPDVAQQVRDLTDRAMQGTIPLESVYGRRLQLVNPTALDIVALAKEYERTLAAGAREAVPAMRAAGVRVVLVSGGIRQAIQPVADALGAELRAVDVAFGAQGEYVAFDKASPLTRQDGKRAVVQALGLARPSLAVGDGGTDLFMASEVDRFMAYTGFVEREPVIRAANGLIATFAELLAEVLGT